MENQILSDQPIQPQILIDQTPHPTNANSPTPDRRHTSKWIILPLLYLFPPAAWYLMWREKRYHSWLSIGLLFFGLIPLLAIALVYLIIIPTLTEIYGNVSIENPSQYIYPATIIGSIISVAQIIFALYTRIKVKKYGQLSKKLLTITAILLALNYLLISIVSILLNIKTLMPIYTLISTIYTF